MDDSQRQSARREAFLERTDEQTKRIVPAFATEAEEAVWWYNNRNVHGKQLLAAVKAGGAKILTRDEPGRRIDASRKPPAPVVALRIPSADLALARKQAEQRGRTTSNPCPTKRSRNARSGRPASYMKRGLALAFHISTK
jgi:hypothetical protein